ncbi:hypothetical protein P43SY_000135 [Pythium insidiosum]|uniref:Uncharacterized protein n=1 Tax=Pythium insidiosum TaxID=114742 RepID=A0AAD5QAH9_PYTIN|nr:hypothetical protein P43SY_000135 [Pythium insidiosum]
MLCGESVAWNPMSHNRIYAALHRLLIENNGIAASALGWTVEALTNGKVALKSDSGRYIARCRGCAPGSPADRAFVHSTTSNDPIRELDGSFSWIHGLSTYSLASLGVGIYQIRRKNVLAHKRAMQGLYAGAMVAGFFAVAEPGRRLHSEIFRSDVLGVKRQRG